MKRKILLTFLSIITAVCICFGFSACDLLDELADSLVDAGQTSTDDSGSTGGGSTDDGDTTGGEGSTGDSDETDEGSTDDGGSTGDGESSGSEDESGDTDGEGSSGDSGSADDEGSTDDDGSTDDSGSTGDGGKTDDGDETGGGESSGSEDESGETTADITARAGNGVYGYSQLASETNGADMQKLYYQMYAACETFITDTGDLTASNGNYSIAEISYVGYNLTKDEALSVWKTFYLENPMYYWLSSSCVYSESSGKLYLTVDEAYASYSVRAAYDKDISAMISEASAAIPQNGTELEKALAIHDYIISKIDYAYQSDGVTPETAIWAHNITGVSSAGYGVCEAYSKTCLALCLINGLDCVIATGTATSSGEAHAWNIIKINGEWYGVDCTWDDTGDNSDLSYIYFGMNADAINSTRTTGGQTYGVNYLYELPDTAAYGIQPVTLFKNGTDLGIYLNVDDAFAAMTDSSADYVIEFYFINTSGTLVYTSPATTVYIYSESTPTVKSITINGVYTDLGGGYFYVSYLTMAGKLTLNCDLTISNIILTAAELDLGEYTLATDGYYCRLDGTIYDNKTTETISIKATTASQTDIYAAMDISYYYGRASIRGTAVIGTYYGSDMLSVYGTVTIDKYISANETSYYNVYLQNGASLTVNNLIYADGGSQPVYILIQFESADGYPSLCLGSVGARTYLFISGNISETEAAAPENLTCAIATLKDGGDFANMAVYFGSENKTSLYTVNANNEIIYKNA